MIREADEFDFLAALSWDLPRRRREAAKLTHQTGLPHDAEAAYHQHVTLEAARRGIPERELVARLEWEQALIVAGFEPRTEAVA